MSELTKLLEGVNVEWKSLGEVAELKRGTTITAKSKSDGDIPVISGGQKPAYYNDKFNRENETVTIAGSGAYAGFVSYWNEPIFVADAFSIKPSRDLLNTLYIYHILKSKQDMIYKLKKGVGVPHVYPKDLGKFLIPIPCPDNPEKSLKIQQEIVRILDRLSEETNQLTEALQKELDIHQKQYNFYREELFKFEGKEVEWKSLGEIGEVKRGVAFTKKQAIYGNIPVVANAAEPICYHNEFNRAGEFIVVSRSGANAGLISYWNKEVYLTDAFSIHPNILLLNTKFTFYYLKKFQNEIHFMKRGSGVPHVRASDFEIYKIPVPSLSEQERIVKILDDLDAETKAITKAIQKEIALRNKQYEYYRDRLLSFHSLQNDAEAI